MNNLRKEPARAVLLLLGATTVCAIMALSRGIVGDTGAVPGSYPDVYHFVWNAWYPTRSLNEGFSYTTNLLFWPNGTSLHLHTLTEGVLLPVAILFRNLSPAQLYTLACAICLALNWSTLTLLLSTVSRSRWTGMLLGTACISHPFWYAHLDGGHLNMLAFFPIPLCILIGTTVRNAQRGAMWGRIIGGGCCLAFLAFTNLYYFYFLMLLLAFGAAASLWYQHRESLIYCATVPLVGVALAAPRLLAVARIALARTFSANHDPSGNSINILHLFVPGSYQHLATVTGWMTPAYPAAPNPTETAVCLGGSGVIAVLLILGLGQRRERAGFLAAFTLFALLACGPVFHFGGFATAWNPVYSLLQHLPLFPSVPARFFVVGLLMLLIALAHVARYHRPAVMLLAIASVCEWFPKPIAWQTIKTTPVLDTIRQSTITALHDATPSLELRSLHQIFHGKPITAGFLARVPRKEMQQLRRNKFLAFIEGRRTNLSVEERRTAFDSLRVDAVLIPVSDGDMTTRTAACDWLSESTRDGEFVLFQVRQPIPAGQEAGAP